MELTLELAATAAQVIPVFAVGSLVAYTAQVRSHNTYLRPYLDAINEINTMVIQWDSEGLAGYELIQRGNRYVRAKFGPDFKLDAWELQGRLWAVMVFLAIILANAAGFVLALLRLANSPTPPNSAPFVVVSMILGLAATALIPIVARSRGLGGIVGMLNYTGTKQARAITRRARSTMTNTDWEHEKRFKAGVSEPDEMTGGSPG